MQVENNSSLKMFRCIVSWVFTSSYFSSDQLLRSADFQFFTEMIWDCLDELFNSKKTVRLISITNLYQRNVWWDIITIFFKGRKKRIRGIHFDNHCSIVSLDLPAYSFNTCINIKAQNKGSFRTCLLHYDRRQR